MASQVPIGIIDASRGGTTVETWTPMAVLQEMDSETTQAKLTSFAEKVAQWDAKKDLGNRIKQHQEWVKRQAKQGNKIPENRKEEPSDLRPGPAADHNHPGYCYAGMIAPLKGMEIAGVIFHQGYNNCLLYTSPSPRD